MEGFFSLRKVQSWAINKKWVFSNLGFGLEGIKGPWAKTHAQSTESSVGTGFSVCGEVKKQMELHREHYEDGWACKLVRVVVLRSQWAA